MLPGSFIAGESSVSLRLLYTENSRTLGVYTCQNGTREGIYISKPFKPNIITIVTLYGRQVHVVVFRSNSSIISTTEVTPVLLDAALDL